PSIETLPLAVVRSRRRSGYPELSAPGKNARTSAKQRRDNRRRLPSLHHPHRFVAEFPVVRPVRNGSASCRFRTLLMQHLESSIPRYCLDSDYYGSNAKTRYELRQIADAATKSG